MLDVRIEKTVGLFRPSFRPVSFFRPALFVAVGRVGRRGCEKVWCTLKRFGEVFLRIMFSTAKLIKYSRTLPCKIVQKSCKIVHFFLSV